MSLSSWSASKLVALAIGLFVVAGGSFLVGATLLVVAANVGGGADNDVVEEDDGEEAADGDVAGGDAAPPQPEERGIFGTLADKASRVFSPSGVEQPRFEGNRPIGLYLMSKFWIATGHLEKSVWYFTSDGRVYLDPEGITPEQLAAHEGEQGTVSVTGSDLSIRWNDGKVRTSDIEREAGEDGFAWDTGIYAPMTSFSDPQQLVGRWEGGESVSFSGSHAATSKTLDIRADGTFSRAAVASLQSESDESVVSAGSQGNTSGTWKLDGYTLTLTYGSGEVVRSVSFPFDDEKTPLFPDRFYFAGTMYKKL